MHPIDQSVFTLGNCCIVGGKIVSLDCCGGQCDCPQYKKLALNLAGGGPTAPQPIRSGTIKGIKPNNQEDVYELDCSGLSTIETAMVGSWTIDVRLNGEVIGTLEFETTNTSTDTVAVANNSTDLKLTIYGNCVYEVRKATLMRYMATGMDVLGDVQTD